MARMVTLPAVARAASLAGGALDEDEDEDDDDEDEEDVDDVVIAVLTPTLATTAATTGVCSSCTFSWAAGSSSSATGSPYCKTI